MHEGITLWLLFPRYLYSDNVLPVDNLSIIRYTTRQLISDHICSASNSCQQNVAIQHNGFKSLMCSDAWCSSTAYIIYRWIYGPTVYRNTPGNILFSFPEVPACSNTFANSSPPLQPYAWIINLWHCSVFISPMNSYNSYIQTTSDFTIIF